MTKEKQIIELLNKGISKEEIVSIVGCSIPSIYRAKAIIAGTYKKATDADTRRHRYGISQTDYLALLAEQSDRCAICHKHSSEVYRSKLYVDHSHNDGHIRGLLCNQCNSGIGTLSTPALLIKAKQHLRSILYIPSTSKIRPLKAKLPELESVDLADTAEIIRLYNMGYGMLYLAKKANTTMHQIHKYFIENNIPIRPRGGVAPARDFGDTRECQWCKQILPMELFRTFARYKYYACKQCYYEYIWIAEKYNLPAEIYKAALDTYTVCPILDIPLTKENVCVDHCHIHKYIRGLLSKQANIALGLLQDSSEILDSAIQYLNMKGI
jgi:hypothetical protein